MAVSEAISVSEESKRFTLSKNIAPMIVFLTDGYPTRQTCQLRIDNLKSLQSSAPGSFLNKQSRVVKSEASGEMDEEKILENVDHRNREKIPILTLGLGREASFKLIQRISDLTDSLGQSSLQILTTMFIIIDISEVIPYHPPTILNFSLSP